jgi:hypothetical protein
MLIKNAFLIQIKAATMQKIKSEEENKFGGR